MALLVASRKLRHYFDAHPITIYTSHLLKDALRRADFSGRMEKWYVELGRFHIEYLPRTSIKGQVIADLIAEFTEPAEVLIEPAMLKHPEETSIIPVATDIEMPMATRGHHTLTILTTASMSQRAHPVNNS